VFEMIVEGGVTRFSAIFHSRTRDTVGPVRSYRFSDLHITQMLRGALVASGSTIEEHDAVAQSIKDGNMISVDAEPGRCGRTTASLPAAPNNEFTGTPADREAVNRAGGSRRSTSRPSRSCSRARPIRRPAGSRPAGPESP
jgi:hypothetical protein